VQTPVYPPFFKAPPNAGCTLDEMELTLGANGRYTIDFDKIINRRGSDSVKWGWFADDVLPLWVADVDFLSPPPVLDALRERVGHGVFGYGTEPSELREVVVERLQRLYGWHVSPEALLFVPGVVPGFNLACQAVTTPGDGVLVQTPVYPPFFKAPPNAGCTLDEMELTLGANGRYTIDFDGCSSCATRTIRWAACSSGGSWSTWPRSACATTS